MPADEQAGAHGADGEVAAVPSLQLRGLAKRFGKRRALAGLDLVLTGPQIVGIVGPDGAGKTTLLRAITGLLEIEAREATVLGVDLMGDVRPLKARTGYVPQAFSLHRDLSVLENLRFTARLHRMSESEFLSRVTPLLERTGLAPFTDRAAAALSGGMKQKLAIANALLPEPALLVLDEPTAGVDVAARAEIWSMLHEACDRTLILISTSYLEEASQCDRLVYLDDGRVVASGTPDELCDGVSIELYRIWGDDARAIAQRVRTLPYVAAAHARRRFVRVVVSRTRTPGTTRVLADLAALGVGPVRLVEQRPVDMEATLLAFGKGMTS
jgi:ABC-2 type transport system ATP-binding protein